MSDVLYENNVTETVNDMETQDTDVRIYDADQDPSEVETPDGNHLSKGEAVAVGTIGALAVVGLIYIGKTTAKGAKWLKRKAGAKMDARKEKKLKKEAEKQKEKTEAQEPVADVEVTEEEVVDTAKS